jgi:hypothetical protein
MISVLVDHNIEGQARLIWNAVPLEEWAAFQIDRFYELPELGIAVESSDREIYRFLQSRGMLLLTGNRITKVRMHWKACCRRKLLRTRSRSSPSLTWSE